MHNTLVNGVAIGEYMLGERLILQADILHAPRTSERGCGWRVHALARVGTAGTSGQHTWSWSSTKQVSGKLGAHETVGDVECTGM